VDEIGKILPSLFRKQIRRTDPRLLEILQPLWPRIVGKTMAQHSQPAQFSSSALTLATDSATWTTQLQHMTEEIRAEINSFLGQAVVKKLRIKTVTQPGLFFAPPLARETVVPPAPQIQGEVDTSAVSDPATAAVLASSYAKYFCRAGR
jgi:hypothetical protein